MPDPKTPVKDDVEPSDQHGEELADLFRDLETEAGDKEKPAD